ncbi:TetR/AcrR family transcriptional regulator [Sorangium sp. So ce1389]|uniref:TetR/AcrR family transcriptional regulator n=1 Tax=Sorangium sp. So ce1389 TaxID=3133336 RepID=UPI003F5E1427
MSSKDGDTRAVILEAARRLVTEPGRRGVSMAEIASAAGVSRQAVYLHFETRTQLLVALVRHVDEVHGFADLVRKCERAPDARAVLSEFIGAWADYVAHITDVARAMRAARATDEDAELAWRDRMRGFTGVCAGFVARLQAEGALADEWSASDAADFLATILSIGNWQELIEERSWSRPRYVRAMRRSVEQSLLRPREIKTAPRRRS